MDEPHGCTHKVDPGKECDICATRLMASAIAKLDRQFQDDDDEHAANLAAQIWAAGADHETARFVAKQLLKKGLWLVPDRATEDMWQAGKSADIHPGDSYSAVYLAMLAAAPKA